MWFSIIAAVVVAYLIYKLFFSSKTKTHAFYKTHGIREIDYSPAVNKLEVILGWKPLHAADDYVYQQLGHEKFGGMTEMGAPFILVKDVNLIKKIMIKDFDHFVDRRDLLGDSEYSDAWMKRMLFFMKGEEWKGVRSAVSPIFTTGKIRRMMNSFNCVGLEWVDDLKAKATENGGSLNINVGKVVINYTVDVIASSAFGMNAGAIKDPSSKFAKYALKLTEMGKVGMAKFVLKILLPKVFDFFRISLFDPKAISFFRRLLDHGLKSRMSGEIKRNDFLQLIAEAKRGELKSEMNDELSQFEKDAAIQSEDKKQWLTDEVMSSLCLMFFFAGFQPTTGFITFVIYVLAAHQDVQNKVRAEVGGIVKDGLFDYDELGQLPYLDMVIHEVNRKYPGSGRLERLCIKDYKDSESGLSVPKGTTVIIPAKSIQHDKRYYHNADQFYPEHWTPECRAERSPYVFLPFGIGPRNCIGMRFALIESKAAIAHLVHNFVIKPTEKTPLPVRTQPAGLQEFPPKDLEVMLIPVARR